MLRIAGVLRGVGKEPVTVLYSTRVALRRMELALWSMQGVARGGHTKTPQLSVAAIVGCTYWGKLVLKGTWSESKSWWWLLL